MKLAPATIKGLITGFVMIALSLLFFYGLKMPANGREQFAVLSAYVIGIAWSLISYKRSTDAQRTFKEYFSVGFKTFIVVTLLMVVFTFIFYKCNLQIREDGIAENNKLLLQEGDHTPAEIEKNADKLRSIFIPLMMGIATFKYL